MWRRCFVYKHPRILDREHRRLAASDDVLRPTHRVGRVDGKNLAGDQPIEALPDRSQVLFDRRFFVRVFFEPLRGFSSDLLDIIGDVEGLDVG